MAKIQAVLFDFDGTLVDSVEVFYRIAQDVSDQTGGSMTRDDFFRLNGLPIKEATQIMLKEKKLKRRSIAYAMLKRKKYLVVNYLSS